MRFGSTAKVLLKCKLKYYRISECLSQHPVICSKENGEILSEGASANGAGLPGDLGGAAAQALNGSSSDAEVSKGESCDRC